MTDQLQLPQFVRDLFAGRTFSLRSVSRDPFGDVSTSDEVLDPQEALDKLDFALSYPATLEAVDLAQFVGALVLGVPGQVLLEESHPRASCGCCNYDEKEFLVVD